MRGRPIDPNSESQRKPWKLYGLSKASYYIKKKYGDLPFMSKKRKHHGRKLSAHDVGAIKRTACEWKGYKWIPWVAFEYGVSVTTIHNIINEHTHRDIEILPREENSNG